MPSITHPQFGLQLHYIAEIVLAGIGLAQPAGAVADYEYFADALQRLGSHAVRVRGR